MSSHANPDTNTEFAALLLCCNAAPYLMKTNGITPISNAQKPSSEGA